MAWFDANWLPTIRKIQTIDEIWIAIPKLPDDVAERLLKLTEGEFVTPPAVIATNQPITASQDTKRRFFVLESNDDLIKMLEAPLATWVAFLHPSQQKLATGSFKGPVKISGSAGTGKTVVAMHRARHLARQGKRVFLTSYVSTLCENIERNLKLLCTPEERSLITVATVHSQGLALAKTTHPELYPITNDEVWQLIDEYHNPDVCPLKPELLKTEWEVVIQDQGITSWDSYRNANRIGRGFSLTVKERKQVWQIFEQVFATLHDKGCMDYPSICRQARELVATDTIRSPFDAVIVDELQDLRPQEIMLLSALAGNGADSLTLFGDGGQRIYSTPFSLKALGIDVRGRSHILRINYRTTEQIRQFADAMLGPERDDLDGGQENRRGTISLLSGPHPVMKGFNSPKEQQEFLLQQIQQLIQEGLAPDEIAIFARTNKSVSDLEDTFKQAGLTCHNLRKGVARNAAVNLGTMHRAKGLEFKAVFVVNVSDDQMPLKYILNQTSDAQFHKDIYARERQLLYVSLTRARDELFITWEGTISRFLSQSGEN
ncbi:3'-5' exonuclease [Leptolyngbya sp. AN02str]|uniref:3'-5' exonuclease n=1 Tax=Leptolyngbya sp. AN02str TaxID=3423363 RepID=UPI003D322F37